MHYYLYCFGRNIGDLLGVRYGFGEQVKGNRWIEFSYVNLDELAFALIWDIFKPVDYTTGIAPLIHS